MDPCTRCPPRCRNSLLCPSSTSRSSRSRQRSTRQRLANRASYAQRVHGGRAFPSLAHAPAATPRYLRRPVLTIATGCPGVAYRTETTHETAHNFLEKINFKDFPSGYSKSVCPHSESSEPTMLFSQTTPDENPPTPPPCRWPDLITLPTLTKFQFVWRRL